MSLLELTTLMRIAHQSSWHEPNKKLFKRLSKRFLRAILKSMDLPIESADIHFEAGGPGVSGDASLHHDDFYLWINGDSCLGGQLQILGRTCTSRKDYTGGQNQFLAMTHPSADEESRMLDWVYGIRKQSLKLKKEANPVAA